MGKWFVRTGVRHLIPLVIVAVAASCAGDEGADGPGASEARTPESGSSSTASGSEAPPSAEPFAAVLDDWSDEVPIDDVTDYPGSSARLGELAVVVPTGSDGPQLAVVREDGMWATLPPLPQVPDQPFASFAGSTLYVTGGDCEDRTEDECDSGTTPLAFRYDAREREWREFELPGVEAPTSGISPLPGISATQTVLTAEGGPFTVDEDGGVRTLPEPPHGRGNCVVGDQLVALDADSTTVGKLQMSPTIETLDLDAAELEWVAAPDRDPTAGLEVMGSPDVWFAGCGPNGPIFLGDRLEAVYDVRDGAWVQNEVGLPVHLDPQFTNGPRIDSIVVLADHTLVATTGSRALVRRTPTGHWEDLARYSNVVVGAGDTAFVWTDGEPEPLRLDD